MVNQFIQYLLKLFITFATLFCIFFIATGCSALGSAATIVAPLASLDTDINISSVFYDKTRPYIVKNEIAPIAIVPERSLVYVMPAIINKNHEKFYDEYYSSMIKNYLSINNLAEIVDDIAKADFIVMTQIAESPEKRIGKNFSNIVLSILEHDERSVFYTRVQVESRSDENFYHRPSRAARPVSQLSEMAMNKIFKTNLPRAFGLVK